MKCEHCDRIDKHGHHLFYKDGVMIEDDDIELKNSKANLSGWSQSELWLNGERAGFIESGGIFFSEQAKVKGYTHKEINITNQ